MFMHIHDLFSSKWIKTHLATHAPGSFVLRINPFSKEQTKIHDFLPPLPNCKTMPRSKLRFHFYLIQYRIDLLQQINTINTLGFSAKDMDVYPEIRL